MSWPAAMPPALVTETPKAARSRPSNVNPAAKLLELENEDTITYDSLVAGSFQVVIFGASFGTVQSVNVSGGDPDFADVATIHNNVRRRVPTIVSPLSFGIDNICDLADPGFAECNKAYKAESMRAVRLRFGAGAKMLLLVYVDAGQAQGVVQTKVSI